MNEFINTLEEYFGKRAPALPKGGKEFLVKAAPYLTILGVLVMIPALLALLGLGAFVGTFAMYSAYGYGYGKAMIGMVFSVIILVLYVIAIPGLFKRNSSGWNFIFYASLVSALEGLLMMNIIGAIIGLAISLYILFQIKSYYFGGATIESVPTTPPSEPHTPSATTNQ